MTGQWRQFTHIVGVNSPGSRWQKRWIWIQLGQAENVISINVCCLICELRKNVSTIDKISLLARQHYTLYTLNILKSFKLMKLHKLLIKHLKWRQSQNINLGIVLPPSRPCRMPGTGGSESCLGNGLGKHRLCAKCLASEEFPRSSNLHVDMSDVYNEMYGYVVVQMIFCCFFSLKKGADRPLRRPKGGLRLRGSPRGAEFSGAGGVRPLGVAALGVGRRHLVECRATGGCSSAGTWRWCTDSKGHNQGRMEDAAYRWVLQCSLNGLEWMSFTGREKANILKNSNVSWVKHSFYMQRTIYIEYNIHGMQYAYVLCLKFMYTYVYLIYLYIYTHYTPLFFCTVT